MNISTNRFICMGASSDVQKHTADSEKWNAVWGYVGSHCADSVVVKERHRKAALPHKHGVCQGHSPHHKDIGGAQIHENCLNPQNASSTHPGAPFFRRTKKRLRPLVQP